MWGLIMGSGGSHSSAGRSLKGNKKDSVFTDVKPITVESRYIEGRGFTRGRYTDTVLQAVNKGNGEIELAYATPDKYEKTAKTNKTNHITYTLDHGFVNSEPHGLNFEKISSFSGQTYQVKEELKKRGFKFKNGKWVKE